MSIPTGRVTIRTIAEAAGVNVGTVSRALRGVRGVSPGKRDQIRTLARQLGYHPNPFVAAFTAQVRSYRRAPHAAIIALLDCWPDARPIWANFNADLDYMSGIRERATALGYTTELFRLSDLNGSVDRLNKLLVTRRIHGLLVLPVPDHTDLRALDYSRLASATIDFSLKQPFSMRRASSNYHHNLFLVLDVLVARGYRRIGLAMTRLASMRQDHFSLSSFLSYHALHPGTCIPPCLSDIPDFSTALDTWLAREKPDALITCDITPDASHRILGRRIPRDLGYVNLSGDNTSGHPVAHVDENYHEIGVQAVNMVIDAIHRNEFSLPSTRVVHLVDGLWNEGPTLRPPPATRPRCAQDLGSPLRDRGRTSPGEGSRSGPQEEVDHLPRRSSAR